MKNMSRYFDRDGRIWMWLDIALVAFIALAFVVVIYFREETGQPHGYAWVLFPIGLLSWISVRRFNAGFLIKGILAWGAIFLFLLTAYTYRFELQAAGERVLATIQ
ncbi:MAG: hypothetical protein OXF29_06255 [Hyphomicrobiales bacterium]|nr:hypothetical protein [Hyphomicrobiales bacterium]